MANVIFLKSLFKTTFAQIFVTSAIFTLVGANLSGNDDDPYRHSFYLDQHEKYLLEWGVDWTIKSVTFNVTVETTGYVGFGLSRKGKMSGADIVIGGVTRTGKPYFSDRHAIANQLPEEDTSQDWTLHTAWENGTHTYLSFSRPFETCDEDHDLPIGDDFLSLIWAYGENDDDIQYHFQNRGQFNAYLLDPDLTPQRVHEAQRKKQNLSRLGNWKVWTLSISQPITTEHTSYLCTFHKAPQSKNKMHMVGFRKILPTAVEIRHIHHSTLFRCHLPAEQNMDRMFGRYVNRPGETCYILGTPSRIPTQYCMEIAHAWSIGANPIFFPEHVGIPLSSDEYYMFQVHYDNRNRIPGVEVNFDLEIFYTDQLRKYDGGTLFVGTALPGSPSIMLPSNEIDHEIHGYCGGDCTKMMFSSGVQFIAGKLHTHLTGVAARIGHVRKNQELAYVTNDDNFNPSYQPVRLLQVERKIVPGDAIIKRCLYSTTDRNGSATVGNFPLLGEMCTAFIWYYPRIQNKGIFSTCSSEIRSKEYGNFLGIWNTTWSQDQIESIVTAPHWNAGLSVQEVGTRINWTIEKRRQLQYFHRYLPQITKCPDVTPEAAKAYEFNSDYSDKYVNPYEKPNLCSRQN